MVSSPGPQIETLFRKQSGETDFSACSVSAQGGSVSLQREKAFLRCLFLKP